MSKFSYDVSTLFGSLNSNSNSSGNLFNSINLTDYYSIKSGSYGKLMKSYYAEQKSSGSSSTSATTDKSSTVTDTTGLSKMKKVSDELKSSAEKLSDSELWKQTGGEYNTEKIVDSVKDFADKYNAVISQTSNVSNSGVSTAVNYMKSMTSTMSKALSKAGITVGTDGKMSVNEDTLKSAKMSDVKSLLSGASSYSYQIENKAADISKAALSSSATYTSNGVVSSTLAGLFDTSI